MQSGFPSGETGKVGREEACPGQRTPHPTGHPRKGAPFAGIFTPGVGHNPHAAVARRCPGVARPEPLLGHRTAKGTNSTPSKFYFSLVCKPGGVASAPPRPASHPTTAGTKAVTAGSTLQGGPPGEGQGGGGNNRETCVPADHRSPPRRLREEVAPPGPPSRAEARWGLRDPARAHGRAVPGVPRMPALPDAGGERWASGHPAVRFRDLGRGTFLCLVLGFLLGPSLA